MNARNHKPVDQTLQFSLILPTYNRGYCIEHAIQSVLYQTFSGYELIIVDDGSTDDTERIIASRYQKELASGRIRYLKQEENRGVCHCRNIGLAAAKYDWIGYIDSDNTIKRIFLATFADAMKAYPKAKAFYANWKNRERGTKGSWHDGDFSYDALLGRNYIDLGVYVHHRDCYMALGGFDEELRRLVDWDLILRYSKKYPPAALSSMVMSYNDTDTKDRITHKENLRVAMNRILEKHNPDAVKLSVVILSYNHEKYIKEAIDSVLSQRGAFLCEILLSDDGSTDRTPEIMAEYAAKYPTLIRNISSTENVGISRNYKRCFQQATGKYVAVLEGDDYWKAADKLLRQMEFLQANPDCSMVFSRILMIDEAGTRIELRRQQYIYRTKLTGYDFLADRFLNLIVNFSCCMFITKYMQQLPEILYSLRLSEIPLAFYLEQKGPIGYIPHIDSVYRKLSTSVWHGGTNQQKFRASFEIRKLTLHIADRKYKKLLFELIRKQYFFSPLAEELITEKDKEELASALISTEQTKASRLGIFLLDRTAEIDETHVESIYSEIEHSIDRVYVVCGEYLKEKELFAQIGAAVIPIPDGCKLPTLEQVVADYVPKDEVFLYDEVISIQFLTKPQVTEIHARSGGIRERSGRKQNRFTFFAERGIALGKASWNFYKKNGLIFTLRRIKEKLLRKRKAKEPASKMVD